MSWKRSGHLISGPPSASLDSAGPSKLSDRIRPNGGTNTFRKERELVSRYGGSSFAEPARKSEWDVLKENHRFIRDDEESKDVSWEERLARAYESKLFKEFALIDLKHYKSKRLALRWRTAPEVVEGIGEDTCGSLRCKYHTSQTSILGTSDSEDDRNGTRDEGRIKKMPKLRAFELPFQYIEEGKKKEALVKVKLCPKCEKKLKWKPAEEPEEIGRRSGTVQEREDQIVRGDAGREAAEDYRRVKRRSVSPETRNPRDKYQEVKGGQHRNREHG